MSPKHGAARSGLLLRQLPSRLRSPGRAGDDPAYDRRRWRTIAAEFGERAGTTRGLMPNFVVFPVRHGCLRAPLPRICARRRSGSAGFSGPTALRSRSSAASRTSRDSSWTSSRAAVVAMADRQQTSLRVRLGVRDGALRWCLLLGPPRRLYRAASRVHGGGPHSAQLAAPSSRTIPPPSRPRCRLGSEMWRGARGARVSMRSTPGLDDRRRPVCRRHLRHALPSAVPHGRSRDPRAHGDRRLRQ